MSMIQFRQKTAKQKPLHWYSKSLRDPSLLVWTSHPRTTNHYLHHSSKPRTDSHGSHTSFMIVVNSRSIHQRQLPKVY